MIDLLVKFVADGFVILVALIASWTLVFKIPRGKRFEAYCRILMAGLTAYLAAKLIASIYQPAVERPFELLGKSAGAAYLNNPGFPSDHALFAAVLTLAVWFETKRKMITLVLVTLTLLMCLGRVLALVHTPLDVIGGLLIASIGTLWYDWQKPRLAKIHHTTRSHKIQE